MPILAARNVISATGTAAIATATASSFINDNASRREYISTTLTSIIACIVPMIALLYIAILSVVKRYASRNPKAINKATGRRIDRYAPVAYMFLTFTSLAEVAFASWLILQWRFLENYPRLETLNGTRVLLFTSCWTTVISAIYTLLFVHPMWSKHPVSSVGTQAVWVFITWLLWIISSGMINASVPLLLVRGRCAGVVYCVQIQIMFGIAVSMSLILTVTFGGLVWLAWKATKGIIGQQGADYARN